MQLSSRKRSSLKDSSDDEQTLKKAFCRVTKKKKTSIRIKSKHHLKSDKSNKQEASKAKICQKSTSDAQERMAMKVSRMSQIRNSRCFLLITTTNDGFMMTTTSSSDQRSATRTRIDLAILNTTLEHFLFHQI